MATEDKHGHRFIMFMLTQDLRKLGLMDGNPAHRQHDMLQINYEKKLRATLETLLSLAKEKVCGDATLRRCAMCGRPINLCDCGCTGSDD